MTATDIDEAALDELGPVDYIVVEFPGRDFDGSVAPALLDLVDRKLIRVLDLILLRKDEAGELEIFELTDLADDEVGGLRRLEADLASLLSEDDVINLAGTIEPGTTAAALVWENLWAAPFGSAMRHAGGQLVASGRIPIQAMLAAIEDDNDDES